MSEPQYEPETPACRIKIWRTARGESQYEVSVSAGADEEEVRRIREIALHEYLVIQSELRS